jgi:acetolactate synthase-1/2/3 large subunit
MHQSQLPILGEIVGDIVVGLTTIAAGLGGRTDWDGAAVQRLAQAQRDRMRPAGEPGRLHPHRVVELVAEAYPGARVTVDAGAHMFPVLSLWPAEEPCGVLISNGLATMGFALPAAIGAALIDDTRPTIAFTGDGGLLMCVAELRTAAREQVPVRVIVFDDQTLSLIKVKQQQRGYATRGVAMGTTKWEHVGAAFDVPTRVAADEASLTAALQETAGHRGPVLIAAQIAADTYEATLRALRG